MKRDLVFHDRDGRNHELRLVRHTDGVIYAEVSHQHNGQTIYCTLKLGEAWELTPRLLAAFGP